MSVSRFALPPHFGQAIVELGHLRQWRAGAGDLDVLRKHDRQLVVGYRHVAAGRAVDDRDRAAPVALARDAPVAQAELVSSPRSWREVGGDGVDGSFVATDRRTLPELTHWPLPCRRTTPASRRG